MAKHEKRFFLTAVGTLALILGACAADGSGGLLAGPAGDQVARASLQMLPGCYSVRYQFVEDGAHDFFLEENIEYMDLIPHGQGFVARNIMIVNEQSAFLHWMQEWTPLGDGRWRMRVTDGAGRERYTSEGIWRFNQWEGEPALAVKPTRDTRRTDYDLLERRNFIQLTAERWVQSETNRKLREDGTPVASELGWIVYRRLASDAPCAPAIEMAAENA